MPLDNIPLGDLKEEHLQRLVEDCEQESKFIEFKSTLPGSSHEEHRKFLSSLTSFANTAGGDLIYGIEAPNGIAKNLVGLSGDLDAEIGRLENLIRTGVQLRVSMYEVKAISLRNGRKVLLFRIPRSWNMPHRVTLGSHDKFYARNSNGYYSLDVPELRSLFLQSETAADRIRNFRVERTEKILSGKTPVPLRPGPYTVIHAIPFNALNGSHVFDVSRKYDRNFLAIAPLSPAAGLSYRHNLDGIATYDVRRTDNASRSYLQLFRNGIIESVLAWDSERNQSLELYGQSMEDLVLRATSQYMSVQKDLGVVPPIATMFSLLNVRGATLLSGPFSTKEAPLDHDHLLAPEMLAQDFTIDMEQALRPTFDLIWNAFGYPGSETYGEDGRRIKH